MQADHNQSRNAPYNPFTPDFGAIPPYLAGRQDILTKVSDAFENPGRDPNLTSIFVGARGTGKTALLSYLSSEAEARGWIAVDVTAQKGMLEDILQRTQEAAAHLIDTAEKRRVSGVEIGGIGAIHLESSKENAPNWRTSMNAILDQLAEHGTGLLITVDEVDPLLDEMTSLVTIYQHFVRENRKIGLLMAGLPYNVSSLISGKTTSFLRRATQHKLGTIADEDVSEAIAKTLHDVNKGIDERALDKAVDAIKGFPFMLQLVGYNLWNATASDTFTESDVEHAVAQAQSELRRRVLDATLRELSTADLDFLYAMIPDGDKPSKPSDIAERLGKSSTHVAVYRKRLLEDGVIEETVLRNLRFCLPGFREYLINVEDE